MHERNLYIDRITPLLNTPVIKVITGMRRVGKSCLLKLVIERLRSGNIKEQQIVYINKESLDFDFIRNYQDLHAYVKKCFADVKGLKYLFVDEIQEIEKWENGNRLYCRKKEPEDLYTGCVSAGDAGNHRTGIFRFIAHRRQLSQVCAQHGYCFW